MMPSKRLAFAWTQADTVLLILGQIHCFDVHPWNGKSFAFR